MGVTVKRLEYFDHSMAAKGHPVYAMIVSHEIEEDQSDLNHDGLTPEERRIAEEEKEAERTKRQVEADLGGYDIDDNEIEDVFDIDKSYGLILWHGECAFFNILPIHREIPIIFLITMA